MRIRRTLLSCGLINLWPSWILLLTPFVLPPEKRTMLTLVLDFSYGGGFLLAALLCFLAALLWSEWWEQRIAVAWIRGTRIAARAAGFSMSLAFFAIELLVTVLAHWSLNAIEVLSLAFVILFVQGASISDGDLTPVRERRIWGPQTGGHTRWMERR